jgi:hypothetical protein
MAKDKSKYMPQTLAAVLPRSMPLGLARRLPPPQLIKAWQDLAGEAVAQRARPVCLENGKGRAETGEEGVLVVAVAGAAWRQEISLQAPRLAEALRRQGFPVASLRLVNAPAPAPVQPQPEPRQLTPEDEAAVERQVEGVREPELRAALADAIKAQLRAE